MQKTDENQTSVSNMIEKVESVLGQVEWLSETEGFIRCPGESGHSNRNGRKDCKVYLDRIPTITCFHSSCEDAVKEKNLDLRAALADPANLQGTGPRRKSAEEAARMKELNRKEGIRRRARTSRETVLRDFRWPVAEITKSSPDTIPAIPAEQWPAHLALFRPDDVVWIGDIYDSGKPDHAVNFRRRDDWLNAATVPGCFTCPAVFKEGSFARSNDNVAARRFLVVESDVLKKDEVGAVFRWMKEQANLRLRGIVDTGGKSLHGWFDYPGEAEMADLRLILPEWDCDPKLFTASQPVRLAGAFRAEKNAWQTLLFLDGREATR